MYKGVMRRNRDLSTMKWMKHIGLLVLLGSCAVQSRPQGGPRDEQAPVVVRQYPVEGQLNFSDHSAYILFDEYIQGSKLRGSITSSPPLEGITFTIRGKKLSLEWDEGQLLEETTYRLSLGSEIGDLNENNKVDNLELVWSTGSYIDSLQLHGGIAVSGAVNFQDLTLWLVKAGTDSVVDSKFSATPNKSGQFSLKYMPADTFDLLVFEDINFNKTWDAAFENFGFLKNISTSIDSQFVEIPFTVEGYNPPELDTAAIDSVQHYMDTTSASNLGQISFLIPAHEKAVVISATGTEGTFLDLSQPANPDTLQTELITLVPGTYTVKGFIDENGNGTWDGPSWSNNTLGEVQLSDQNFEVKANWELEQTLILPNEDIHEFEN